MMVVYVAPGKTLRLRGALGPLQAMGTDGAMTLNVQSAGEATDLTVTYAVGGYSKDGFETLSKAVDHVLGEQVARLQKLAETGRRAAPNADDSDVEQIAVFSWLAIGLPRVWLGTRTGRVCHSSPVELDGSWALLVTSTTPVQIALRDELARYAAERSEVREAAATVIPFAGAGIGAAIYGVVLLLTGCCAGTQMFGVDWLAKVQAHCGRSRRRRGRMVAGRHRADTALGSGTFAQ